jgi:hypothetical protein
LKKAAHRTVRRLCFGSFRSRYPGRANGEVSGVMKYRSPDTAPRTKCTVRSVLVVFLPPAFAEVMNVATKGAIVIRPSR